MVVGDVPAHPIAAGQALVHSGIHSSQVNLAVSLLLDGRGSSRPLRLQAVDS